MHEVYISIAKRNVNFQLINGGKCAEVFFFPSFFFVVDFIYNAAYFILIKMRLVSTIIIKLNKVIKENQDDARPFNRSFEQGKYNLN